MAFGTVLTEMSVLCFPGMVLVRMDAPRFPVQDLQHHGLCRALAVRMLEVSTAQWLPLWGIVVCCWGWIHSVSMMLRLQFANSTPGRAQLLARSLLWWDLHDAYGPQEASV